MKETPKEDQVTEYKIKKFMILKKFVKILNNIDNRLNSKPPEPTSTSQQGFGSLVDGMSSVKQEGEG